MLNAYRKLIAAVVGLAVLVLYKQTGIDLTGNEAMFVDTIIAAATAAGVYGFANDPA